MVFDLIKCKNKINLNLKPQKNSTMANIVARLKVGVNTWIKGHQNRIDVFGPTISGFKTFQDTDDPKSVILVFEVIDMEKFKSIMGDPPEIKRA